MPSQTTAILNVGTRILLRDTMDQYIRTLGDYKTYYASNMQAAARALKEKSEIQILILEIDYADGSAYRLLRNLDWSPETSDLYVILAIEEERRDLIALAEEIEVHAFLAKPFSAADLKAQMSRFEAWKALPKAPWQLLVREARAAYRDKRFRETEENFIQAIKSAPDDPVPAFKCGQYFLEKAAYDIAEKFVRRALELKPDYVAAISALGTLCQKRGEYDSAREHFQKAHLLSPLNPDRLVEIVRLNLDWSAELCKTALRIDPGASAARFLLGKVYAVVRDYVGATRELESVQPALFDESKSEAQTFLALARKLGGLAK